LDPFKIIGGVLVALGFIFRAISLAYFNQRAKSVPDNLKAQKKFAGRKQRALMIDALFIGMGFYFLLTH
jgi:fructose-specific phosphotransferase system IIC component